MALAMTGSGSLVQVNGAQRSHLGAVRRPSTKMSRQRTCPHTYQRRSTHELSPTNPNQRIHCGHPDIIQMLNSHIHRSPPFRHFRHVVSRRASRPTSCGYAAMDQWKRHEQLITPNGLVPYMGTRTCLSAAAGYRNAVLLERAAQGDQWRGIG